MTRGREIGRLHSQAALDALYAHIDELNTDTPSADYEHALRHLTLARRAVDRHIARASKERLELSYSEEI